MAARVNKKFVIILLSLLLALTGSVVGAMALKGFFTNARQYKNRGKALLEAHQPELAQIEFGNALRKTPNDLTIIELYTEALSQVPAKDANASRVQMTELWKWMAKAVDLQPTAEAPLERLMQFASRLARDASDVGDARNRDALWELIFVRTSSIVRNHPENLTARKYHGIVIVKRMPVLDVSVSDRGLAEQDLKAVLDKNSDDMEAAYHLEMWRVLMARFLDRPGGDRESAKKLARQADEGSAKWLEGHTNDVPRLLARTRILMALIEPDWDLVRLLKTGRDDTARLSAKEKKEPLTAEEQAQTKQYQALLKQNQALLDQKEPFFDQTVDLIRQMEQALLERLSTPATASTTAPSKLEPPDSPARVLEVANLLVPSDRAIVEREQGLPGTTRGLQRGEALVRAALKLNPQNIRLHFGLASVLQQQRNLDGAIEAYQTVLALKPPPIPADAAQAYQLQSIARFDLADNLLSRIDGQTDPAAKAKDLALVNDLVKQLQATLGKDHYYLNILQGKLAFLDKRWVEATILLDKASGKSKDTDPEALLLSARARYMQGEIGAAAERLEQILKVNPYSVGARYELARVRLQLHQFQDAWQQLAFVLNANPKDRRALELRAQLRSMGAGDGERLRGIDDLLGLKPDEHPELLIPLADAYLRVGKIDDARQVFEKYLDKDPKNLRILLVLLRLTPDPKKAQALIDKARASVDDDDKPYLALLEKQVKGDAGVADNFAEMLDAKLKDDPLELALARYQLFLQLNREKEAQAELAKAAAVQPDDPRVVEAQFKDALRKRDFPSAEALVSKASQLDIDKASGAFLQGELSMAKGDFKLAATQFQRGVQARSVYSEGWRLLGDAQHLSNDLAAAADSYRQAVQLRPNNLDAMYKLAVVLNARDEFFDALKVLRQAVEMSPGDRPMLELYLGYEEKYGDPKAALDRRTERAERVPRDWSNRRELALLLGRTGRPAEGRKIIDQLKVDQGPVIDNAIAAATLLAYEHDDAEALKGVLDYMDGLGDKATCADWLKAAKFLVWMQKPELAQKAYLTAIKLEDPATRPASRDYADLLFDQANFAQAITFYRGLWQAKLDAKSVPTVEQKEDFRRVGLRYVEALLHSNGLTDAEGVLARVEKDCGPDASSCVLAALLAQTKGLQEQALQRLNQAVVLGPSRWVVYYQRGEFYAHQKGQESLAAADLNKALELNERLPQPRLLLAQLAYGRADADQAIAQLTALLKWNPQHIMARMFLARVYLDGDRRLPLRAFLEESVRLFPDEPTWPRLQGEVLLRDKKLDEAIAKFRDAAKLAETAKVFDGQTLIDLAQALVEAGKPAEALAVFDGQQEANLNIPIIAAMRGRILTLLSQPDKGKELFRGALERCQSYTELAGVASQVVAAVGDERAVELLSGMSAGSKSYSLRIQLVLAMLEDRLGRFDAAIKRLSAQQSLVEKGTDEQADLDRELASALMGAKRYKEARKAYERVLESDDRNVAAINNLAYLLTEYLDQPKEGLRWAQRAQDLAPNNAQINDTFAWATYKAGKDKDKEAVRLLRTSIEQQKLPSNCYHLAVILSQTGGRPQEILDLLQAAQILAKEAHDTEFLPLIEAQLRQLPKP